MLEELLKDVEQGNTVLLLFLAFKEQGVVLEELLFALILVLVNGRLNTSWVHELLGLVIRLIDRARLLHHIDV